MPRRLGKGALYSTGKAVSYMSVLPRIVPYCGDMSVLYELRETGRGTVHSVQYALFAHCAPLVLYVRFLQFS